MYSSFVSFRVFRGQHCLRLSSYSGVANMKLQDGMQGNFTRNCLNSVFTFLNLDILWKVQHALLTTFYIGDTWRDNEKFRDFLKKWGLNYGEIIAIG